MHDQDGHGVDIASPRAKSAARAGLRAVHRQCDDVSEIPRRHRDIDLVLLHLGGTMVLGILVTMDVKQGVDLLKLVRPRRVFPIHSNDYDVLTSALSDFEQEVAGAGWQDRVHYLNHGGTYIFHTPPKRAAA